MKCIFCGEDIPSGSLFCPLCGKALPEENLPDELPDEAVEPVEEIKAEALEESAPAEENASDEESVPDEKPQVVFPGRETPVNYFAEAAANSSEIPYGTPVRKEPRSERNAYPVASLVTALVNAVCFLFFGIPFSAAGVIFGILGLKSERRRMSLTALILNGVFVIIGCILVVCITAAGIKFSAELY